MGRKLNLQTNKTDKDKARFNIKKNEKVHFGQDAIIIFSSNEHQYCFEILIDLKLNETTFLLSIIKNYML